MEGGQSISIAPQRSNYPLKAVVLIITSLWFLSSHASLLRASLSAAPPGYGWSDKPSPKEAGPPNTLYNFENWADQLEDFVEQVRNTEYDLSAIQQYSSEMHSVTAVIRDCKWSLSTTSVAELDT